MAGDSRIALDLGRSLRDALDIVGSQEPLEVLRGGGVQATFDLAELAARRRVEQVHLTLSVPSGTGAGVSSANYALDRDYVFTSGSMTYAGTQVFTSVRAQANTPANAVPVVNVNGAAGVPAVIMAVLSTPQHMDSNVPLGYFARWPLYLPLGTSVGIYWNLPAPSDGLFTIEFMGWRQRVAASPGVLWPQVL